jgi:uncharacterized MAPEG superfamily protein
LDAGADLDVGHLEVEVGHLEVGAGHADLDAGHAGPDVDTTGWSHAAAKIFSIRTITYALFGFGAVGTLRTFVWTGGSAVFTVLLAVVTGLLSGALINGAFTWVRRSESGVLEGESAYAGLTGRVTLPIITGSGGRVVVEKGGRWVELRALPHPSTGEQGDPAGWTSVFVVEMQDGVALVAPTGRDFLPQP